MSSYSRSSVRKFTMGKDFILKFIIALIAVQYAVGYSVIKLPLFGRIIIPMLAVSPTILAAYLFYISK